VQIALRPYVTTGIAIVGASVIAVAPVTVPPPDLPSVEVAAVDTVRSMTADVELTALVDLIAAVPTVAALFVQQALLTVPLPPQLEQFAVNFVLAGVPAVTETFKLWTETVPTTALNLIASGQFAHLAVLAANTFYQGTLTPIAPFLVEMLQAIPLPLGTLDGVLNEVLVLGVQTPFLAGTSVLALLAQAIDDGLSPVAVVTGTLDALITAVTKTVDSIEKIVATLGGGPLPFSAMAAPEGLDEARATAVTADAPVVDDASALEPNVNSAAPHGADETAAVAIEPTPQGGEETGTPTEDTKDDASAGDDVAVDDETNNGATDLTDGNIAEPGTVTVDSTGEDNDGSTIVTDDVTTVEGAGDDENETTTDSNTGSDEGSGDDGDSPGE